MRQIKRLFLLVVLASVFLADTALAGSASSISVTFGPFSQAMIGSLPIALPTLSSGMLLVMGLLFAVVALRVLKAQPGSGRLFGVLLMGAGTLLAGLGAERTIASIASTVEPFPQECMNEQTRSYSPNVPAQLLNSCPNDIEIIEYDLSDCPGPVIDGAPPGTVVPASEAAALSYCPGAQPG